MKGMFSPELEKLIEITLADGILTEQEKNVLAKKAAEEGVDLDQLSVYLQYIMQQRQEDENKKRMQAQQELEEASRKLKGKTCPFCGKPVQQLSDQCPHCHGIITAEASQELIEIIDKLEDALIELKSSDDYRKAKAQVEKYIRRANMYYENNPKVQKLLAEISKETEIAEKKAKSSARNKTIANIFKGIGSFIMNHKLLSIIIIWFVLGGIVSVCSLDALDAEEETYELNRAEAQEEVAELSEELDDLIDNGEIRQAVRKLERLTIPDLYGTSHIVKTYDGVFLKVLRELVESGDFSGAESLALTYKSKINNDLSWEDSSCYSYLKSKFKANKKDFSMLKSDYDYDYDE